MMFVRATVENENGGPPDQAMMNAMTVYNKSLQDAGAFISADGLLPSSRGARVSFASSGKAEDTTVTPGPFPPTSTVSGFWIIEAKDLDEAVAWARKVPFKSEQDPVVEVRQMAGAECDWCEDGEGNPAAGANVTGWRWGALDEGSVRQMQLEGLILNAVLHGYLR